MLPSLSRLRAEACPCARLNHKRMRNYPGSPCKLDIRSELRGNYLRPWRVNYTIISFRTGVFLFRSVSVGRASVFCAQTASGGKCANYRRISRHTLELKFNFVERKTDCEVFSREVTSLSTAARLDWLRLEGSAIARNVWTPG